MKSSTAARSEPTPSSKRMSLQSVVCGRLDRSIRILIYGQEGVGKSTCAADAPTPIFLGAEDISDPRVDGNRVRARLGAVFQSYNLFPHLSVLGNVTLASRIVHKVPKKDAEERAMALLERVGLAGFASAHPDRLSGGQQQRVAIARAIATDPEVLLLDEITSALDPELVGEVLDLVRSLAEGGATILMATHEMAFARDVADRVIVLDEGLIVEEGAPASVFTAPAHPRTRALLARITP